ncbi:class I SAM-dependent methyltransferase [Hwanghaeella sp.]|uniref:class I SAM-dependent methyltransferase n=1 Tax=Hwanghaeella sp. TaxID=2605943 RepID=UPI003CCC2C16
MTNETHITGHYADGGLFDRLRSLLIEDGADPDNPSIDDLAPYDQFHGRAIEATRELADLFDPGADAHLLDIGSGIGGPARYLADRFGCRVTGIDLTAEFVDVARRLTDLVGLSGRVDFVQGNALSMPFHEASFDGAYSMNVSMNIADKDAFYREVRRVLRPGAPLILSELASGGAGEVDYPTPWAETEDASFLVSVDETVAGLERAGFLVERVRDATDENLAFGKRSKEMLDRGEKPPHRGVHLIHGPALAKTATGNTAKGIRSGNLVPVEVLCRRRG